MQTTLKIPDYLDARQQFLKAMAKYANQEKHLFMLFDVDNAAALDSAMLESPTRHAEEKQKLNTLGLAFDYASQVHDLAKKHQQKKIAIQQAELNRDLKNLEC